MVLWLLAENNFLYSLLVTRNGVCVNGDLVLSDVTELVCLLCCNILYDNWPYVCVHIQTGSSLSGLLLLYS